MLYQRPPQTLRQQLRKINKFDGVLELACTIAVHCGRSSYFSRGNLIRTPQLEYRTPVPMVGSVICQKPKELVMVRIPYRCSERREGSRAHSGIARKGVTAKVQTLGLNLIRFAPE